MNTDRVHMIGAVAAIALLLALSVWADNRPHDDTDPPWGRSGLQLRTDCLTGLQYLEGGRGGLVPRLDAEGRHMKATCARELEE